ncbi:MAG: MBL fold metallo-hydrolase [Sulfurimonas sp.]
MKKISLIIAMIITFSLSLNAFSLGKLGEFKFENVNKNVWIMHGPVMNPSVENEGFMNNPAIIEGKNSLIVIDPGGNYNVGKRIFAELEKVSKKPIVAIINTHKHGDHWFAGKVIKEKYPNVKSYGHTHMIEMVKNGEADLWYDILERLSKNLKGTNPFFFPDSNLDGTEVLTIDGETFKIFHPKRAHTDTDILVEHVNSKTLFLGDNLMKNRLGGFDDSSSIYGNIELLERIMAHEDGYTEYNLYVPGHGPSGKMHEAIDPFLTYMKIIVKGAEKAYEDGIQGYEAKPEVSQNLKAYHSWDAFDDQMGKHLSKAYSEVEAKDF